MTEKQPLKLLCFHGGGTNGKVSGIPSLGKEKCIRGQLEYKTGLLN